MEISQTVFNLQSEQEYMVAVALFTVQMENKCIRRQTRVTVHVFCRFHSAVHLYEIS